ncbi:MAG TPA: hypothetical protein VLW83_06280 [Candidatus Acidoferrales bacterium]|nr:hypothetical protein [Candidatus Acidoferrales bacterium]
MREDQQTWPGMKSKHDPAVIIMQRQLYLAHFYYHHNPEGILTSTSAMYAIKDLWPAFMEGPCAIETSEAKLGRNIMRNVSRIPPHSPTLSTSRPSLSHVPTFPFPYFQPSSSFFHPWLTLIASLFS